MAARGSRRGREVDGIVIAALLRGRTRTDAALEAGISPRTVYRMLQDDAFRGRLQQAQQEVLDGVIARMAFLAADAVETLGRLLEHEHAPAQLGAAKALLDHTLRWRDAEQLEVRLSALEAIAASATR